MFEHLRFRANMVRVNRAGRFSGTRPQDAGEAGRMTPEPVTWRTPTGKPAELNW